MSYSSGYLSSVSDDLWFSWINNSEISADGYGKAWIGSSRNDTMARLLRRLDSQGQVQSWPTSEIYARFDINVSSVPSAGDGEYFLSFSDWAGNRRGRVFIQRVTSSTFTLGVSYAWIHPVDTTGSLSVNTDYTVVIKLDTTTKELTLWVDPTSEASTSIVSDDNSSQFVYDVLLLRQSNVYGGVGSISIDNVLVGETFNEVWGEIFDVTDSAHGAYPAVAGDSGDDSEGIRQAIAAAESYGDHAIVLFPTGDYIVTETDADYVPEDGNAYLYACHLEEIDDLVIEGSDSRLLVKSSTAAASGYSPNYAMVSPFFFNDCDGLTLKNLFIEWERPSFTVGTVGEVTEETPITNYNQQWSFDVTVEGPPLELGNDAWTVCGISDMDASTGLPLMNISVRDKSHTNFIDWELDNVTDGGVTTSVYSLTVRSNISSSGINVHRTDHLDYTMAQLEGSKVLLHHPSGGSVRGPYGPPSMSAYQCDDVTMRDVTLGSNSGMGLKASECINMAFTRVDILPSDGQLLSTAKDGLFLSLCTGDISFDDCILSGNGDDSINVHATKFIKLTGTIPTSSPYTVTGTPADGSFTGPAPQAGDTYAFVKIGTNLHTPYLSGSSIYTATVTSASRAGNVLTITFDGLPAGLAVNEYMYRTSSLATVSVTDCVFYGGIARGLVLSTEDITVTNSIFENIAFNGIYFLADPKKSGAQAPGAKDVTISGCEFIGCGAAPIANYSPSYSPPSRPSEAGMFADYTISGNLFDPESSAGINAKRLARSTTGGTGEDVRTAYMQAALFLPSLGGTNLIEDNDFGGTNPDNGFAPVVLLNHSTGVSLYDNLATGMYWRRSRLYVPGTPPYDPVPDFTGTPTGSSPDYLVEADEEAIDGSGNPTTSDSYYFGYPRQLGDLQ